jgi:hypothetical protein
MTDEDELRHVLKAAPPEFDPVPLSALQDRRYNHPPPRRVIAVASAAVLVLVIAAGVVFLSRERSPDGGGSTSAPPYTAADTATQNRLAQSAPCTRLPRDLSGAGAIAGFKTVAVVNCRIAERTFAGQGEWEVLVRQVAISGVPQLLDALVEPNDPATPNTACSGVGYLPPQFVLVDRAGNYLHPRFPTDGCGAPKASYGRAVKQVVWRDVSVQRLRQTRSATSVASGCAQAWKNENSIEDSSGIPSSAGGPVFGSTPAVPLKACIYRRAGDPMAGNLVRSVTLKGPDATSLRSALGGVGPTGSCPAQPDYAVVFAGHQYVNVELGGCWRVRRDDGGHTTLGTADPQQLAALLRLH